MELWICHLYIYIHTQDIIEHRTKITYPNDFANSLHSISSFLFAQYLAAFGCKTKKRSGQKIKQNRPFHRTPLSAEIISDTNCGSRKGARDIVEIRAAKIFCFYSVLIRIRQISPPSLPPSLFHSTSHPSSTIIAIRVDSRK